jgi:hypothetical protein
MSGYLSKHPLAPYGNITDNNVNVDSSNWPGSFSSIETSRQFALPSNYSNNADAANASILSGGSKSVSIRKKIKNIVTKYRKNAKKIRKQTKKRLLSFYKKSGKNIRKLTSSSKSRKHKGGASDTASIGNVLEMNPYGPSTLPPSNATGGKHKRQKGGSYHQYQSNVPVTPGYSTGGILSSNELGLANPVPFTRLPNCTNCVDNQNLVTKSGFQFW